MRVLYLTLQPPFPCIDGGTVRVYNQAQQLARSGNEVTIAHFGVVGKCEVPGQSDVKIISVPHPANDHCSFGQWLHNTVPIGATRHFSSLRVAAVEKLAHEADVLLVDGLSPLSCIPEDSQIHARTAVDLVDEVSLRHLQRAKTTHSLARKLIEHFHAWDARRAQRRVCQRYRTCFICSHADLKRLSTFAPTNTVFVSRNGVNRRFLDAERQPTTRPEILFVGSLGYPPNIEAIDLLVHEVHPQLLQSSPDLTLRIVGRGPRPPSASSWTGEKIVIHQDVPDVLPYFEKTWVVVVPMMSGTGIPNKLLEALACGAPTVTSQHVLASAPFEPSVHLLASNSPSGFTEAIQRLLDDPALRQRLSTAGRQCIEADWHWESAGKTIGEQLRELTVQCPCR